jgi:hypothetical protein
VQAGSTAVPSLQSAVELGAVKHDGVRIWVRQCGAPRVDAQIEIPGHQAVTASVLLSAETDWTGVLALRLPEPAPDALFLCTVGGRRLQSLEAGRAVAGDGRAAGDGARFLIAAVPSAGCAGFAPV